ncbi:MAG: hypothetical protein MUQ00_16685 [Candidatus Aminicenantes bacterium]|nr:hypothetical protein [Candidatus Aminicenantes bacterium]
MNKTRKVETQELKSQKEKQKEIEKQRNERLERAIGNVLDRHHNWDSIDFWSANLICSTEKSSRSANKLSARLLLLTWVLVIVGVMTLGIFIFDQINK